MIVYGHLKNFAVRLQGLGLGKDAVIVTHPVIGRLYGKALAASLTKRGYTAKVFSVPAGEKTKSAPFALKLIKQISSYDVDKKILIVALGGGVVGDLAGFVAAIYKRGIPYIQVPTTVLAQLDSAIGGKTAIDLDTGKNLVGAFYQPRMVFSDIEVLRTLSPRQIRNGLAEAIKYGIIHDPKLFAYIEANAAKFIKGDTKVRQHVIRRCAAIKVSIVARDEKETKGLRTILNFGHTVGHAVEAAGQFRYQHGEAVGLGMRVAARISSALGLLPTVQEARINSLISVVGLPQKIQGVGLKRILDLMRHDKKFSAGHNRFVLAQRIGRVIVVPDVPAHIITNSIQAYLD